MDFSTGNAVITGGASGIGLGLADRLGQEGMTVVLVDIEEVYMHCAKSIIRSKLWDTESQIERKTFPSLGEIFADQIGGDLKAKDVDEDIENKYKEKLY